LIYRDVRHGHYFIPGGCGGALLLSELNNQMFADLAVGFAVYDAV
jgi:hypothetical protein